MEEEFPGPFRVDLTEAVGLCVVAYVGIYQKDLFALNPRVAVFKVYFSEPEGFYLCPCKDYPGLKGFVDKIVVKSFFILADEFRRQISPALLNESFGIYS